MNMDAKDWITLGGIIATATMAIVTLLVNWRREKLQQERDDTLRKEQQERDDRLRKEQQERDDTLRKEQQVREESLLQEQRNREAERQKKERTYYPQIEFNIDCNFYGPEQDSYLVEVLLTANNKGRVKQEFKNIILRIRGIEKNKPLTYWEGRKPRLKFPEKLVDNESVVPESVDHFFAEPGETHVFTYVTKIPASINYILAYATFSIDDTNSHDTERVFPVRVK